MIPPLPLGVTRPLRTPAGGTEVLLTQQLLAPSGLPECPDRTPYTGMTSFSCLCPLVVATPTTLLPQRAAITTLRSAT